MRDHRSRRFLRQFEQFLDFLYADLFELEFQLIVYEQLLFKFDEQLFVFERKELLIVEREQWRSRHAELLACGFLEGSAVR